MLAACTKTLICIIIVVRDQNGATGKLKSELGLSVGCNRLACLWKQAMKTSCQNSLWPSFFFARRNSSIFTDCRNRNLKQSALLSETGAVSNKYKSLVKVGQVVLRSMYSYSRVGKVCHFFYFIETQHFSMTMTISRKINK